MWSRALSLPVPFALSLSKGCPPVSSRKEGQGFDRLSPNGVLLGVSLLLAACRADPDQPQFPAASFDRIFLVHMYHEVDSPYAFLWHLRDGLKADGEVIVVDADRDVKHHGIRMPRLSCEFAALGLRPARQQRLEGSDSYAVAFRIAGPKPAPEAIRRCPAE